MIRFILGDCRQALRKLQPGSVHTCVTSPPYWGLRDYGEGWQLGLEPTPQRYVDKMILIFREVRRVLRDDGTLWLNLGDTYNGTGEKKGVTDAGAKQATNFGSVKQAARMVLGLKPKDLVGIPWRVAFALQADGWYLRSDIIWHKPNPMPESVTDRPTKAHEYIFLFAKSEKYYYDSDAVNEPSNEFIKSGKRAREKLDGESFVEAKIRGYGNNCGVAEMRNRRTVWTVTTKPFRDAHFATFPPDLIEPCILAGCPVGGLVLDPFSGAGTTALVSAKNKRNFIGVEINSQYVAMAKKRLLDAGIE